MSAEDEVKSEVPRDPSGVFVKGVSGNPGGRPKGAKTNRLSQDKYYNVVSRLKEEGFDLVNESLALFNDPECTIKYKVQLINNMYKYCAPTIKAIDVSSSDGRNISFNMNFGEPAESVDSDKEND